jgi:hypothetical protein
MSFTATDNMKDECKAAQSATEKKINLYKNKFL